MCLPPSLRLISVCLTLAVVAFFGMPGSTFGEGAEKASKAGDKDAIRLREQELRHMLDSVPGIAWSARSDGLFDMFNARWEETTGAKPPTTVEDWQPFVHPDDWPSLCEHWVAAFAGNRVHAEEWRMRQADGSYRWVLGRAVPVLEEGQTVPRWFGTMVDIDENHRLSEARDLLASELQLRLIAIKELEDADALFDLCDALVHLVAHIC